MSPILALLILLAPQEDDSGRVRETVLGLPGLEEKTAPAPAQELAAPASFKAPRVKRGPDDYKALLDHNVFSPPRKKVSPKPDKDGPKPPEGPKTRSWVLTGIVFNTLEKRYEALFEDVGKEAKYLKAGDAVAGVTISEVTFDQVSYKRGDTPGVLKFKESLQETIAGGSGSAVAPTPEEQGEIEKVRERMKKRHKRESVPDESEDDAEPKKKPK
jgi:hypothetical protein